MRQSDIGQRNSNGSGEENMEKEFLELNQAIADVIENQSEDLNENGVEDQEHLHDYFPKGNQNTKGDDGHYPKGEKHFTVKDQIFYSPDIKKTDYSNRAYLTPPVNFSKFVSPNLDQRVIWPFNMANIKNEKQQLMEIPEYAFSPIITYQYPQMYGSAQSYYPIAYSNNDFFSVGIQTNDDQMLNKMINKQTKKKKNKKGKAYVSQSPVLKSLFSNGQKDQGNKFIQNQPGNIIQFGEKNHISLEAIMGGADKRTTLMVKNIPNKYTISTFLEEINADFSNKYDIFYLPIDYGNKCNLGFAFINFVEPMHIIDFYDTYLGKKWKRFNSEKICDLVYAKIQGKKELISHFEKGKVLSFESEDKRPLILQTPSPLPQITLPARFVDMLLMVYPFAIYHSISNEKITIDSLNSF